MYIDPRTSKWENRFDFIIDRGRVTVFKIVSRNLTCLVQYIRRENNSMVMIVFLTIETHHYQTRTDGTLASWTTYREYKDETIGKSWTINDIIKCCEKTLNRFEKIVDMYVI